MLFHTIGRLALALILVCFLHRGTQAQQVYVGTGLVCDTSEQVEQIVSLANQTRDLNASVEKVNAGTSACGVVTVAYLEGDHGKVIQTPDGKRVIVQIVVVGFVVNQAMMQVPPLPQFTVMALKGEEA